MRSFLKAFLLTVLIGGVVIAAAFLLITNLNTVDVNAASNSFIFDTPTWFEWGMKEGEVRKQHEGNPISSGRVIVYTSQGYNQPYREYDTTKANYSVSYGFSKNNELIYLSYRLDLDPSFSSTLNPVEKRPYLSEFDYIVDEISAKYGEPLIVTDTWFDEKYKDDPDMLNHAIDRKHYSKIALWELDDMYVSVTLYGDINVIYTTDKGEWFYID